MWKNPFSANCGRSEYALDLKPDFKKVIQTFAWSVFFHAGKVTLI